MVLGIPEEPPLLFFFLAFCFIQFVHLCEILPQEPLKQIFHQLSILRLRSVQYGILVEFVLVAELQTLSPTALVDKEQYA